MSSNVYSFLDVVAALAGPGGALSLGSGSGNAEEGISIEPTSESNAMQIGADGAGQHSLLADRSGRVLVRLLKTSPVNAALMAMYNFQRTSAANHGQNTITITDTNRGDITTCEQVAFVRRPPLSYAKEAGIVEWEFHAIRITSTLGV